MNDSAKVFAKRLRDEAGTAPADQVARAFEIAFSRKPSDKEVSSGLAMIKDMRSTGHDTHRFANISALGYGE